jgi:hypothetical protein
MPYIKKEYRKILDPTINLLIPVFIEETINMVVSLAKEISEFEENKGGILNYIISRLCLGFLTKESYKEMSIIRAAINDASDNLFFIDFNTTFTYKYDKKQDSSILSYIIICIGMGFLLDGTKKDVSIIRAAMNDASDEWYRRKMVPYEDKKIQENGDIY